MTIQNWHKRGLLHKPDTALPWSRSYAILPTPELVSPDRLRIYYASADSDSVGRVAYIEVNPESPGEILDRSNEPVFGAGDAGTFDDCGVNPASILNWKGRKYLFYCGYQRSEKVPYLLLAGLAVSMDGGESFERVSKVPLLERTNDEPCIRTAPCVIESGGKLRMWYVAGTGWQTLQGGKMVPKYVIKTAEASEPYRWSAHEEACIVPTGAKETGFGRPWVIEQNGIFRMWFSVRELVSDDAIAYTRIGYAESTDGLHWKRKDELCPLGRSTEGWDSEMVCYPSVVLGKDYGTLFYNGNGNGKSGFGYANCDL